MPQVRKMSMMKIDGKMIRSMAPWTTSGDCRRGGELSEAVEAPPSLYWTDDVAMATPTKQAVLHRTGE